MFRQVTLLSCSLNFLLKSHQICKDVKKLDGLIATFIKVHDQIDIGATVSGELQIWQNKISKPWRYIDNCSPTSLQVHEWFHMLGRGQPRGWGVNLKPYLNPNLTVSHCLYHSVQKNDFPTFRGFPEKNQVHHL